MTIRPSDLPKHARDRLPQPMARARRAADATAAVKRDEAALWFRCARCGGEWTSWAAAERHSRDFRHPRLVCVWATEGEA